MIEFRCKSCSRAIRVQTQYAGRSIRCPQCKAVSVVPAADSRIRFRCSGCNQGMSVSKASANRNVKCPKCGRTITVPSAATQNRVVHEGAQAVSQARPKETTTELRLQEPPAKPSAPAESVFTPDTLTAMYPYILNRNVGEDEHTGQRKYPWIVDIFLYPISTPGLTITAIVVLIPLVINIATFLLGGFGFFVSIPGMVVKIVIIMYLFWYIMQCVADSARGRVRAPEVLTNSPDPMDMLLALLRTVACVAFFLAPMIVYKSYTGRTDMIFWLLLAYAVFFFPMGLLATVMFDSIRGLSPILLVTSIFSTFFQYCVLVVVYYGLTVLLYAASVALAGVTAFAGPLVLIVPVLLPTLIIYSTMICAHLLGRFYWRYQEKLYWDA